MAEIGLVASIFSIAAVGTSVATSLYEAADNMIHANREIYTLAKHVSQFTAVLKHMGEVLDKEKLNCSKEVFHDIKKIKHSCKRTFKEIKSVLKPKRVRRFVSLQWLFKRTKAMELEARLNSQQSMVQCVIHTLTVSKLGQMDSRSQEDSGHLIDLKIEIKLLKTFIMENYNNLTELRHAEHLAQAEAEDAIAGQSHLEDNRLNRNGPPNLPGGFNAPGSQKLRSPSVTSNDSMSGEDEPNSDGDEGADADSTKFKDTNDQPRAGLTGGTLKAEASMSRLGHSTGPSQYNTVSSSTYRESSLFLQMVPFRPRPSPEFNSDRLLDLSSWGPDRGAKTATQEATDSVRLLLDKWTTSGSAPVSNLLDEEAARDEKEADLAHKRRMAASPSRPPGRSSSPLAGRNEDIHAANYSGLHGYPHPQNDHTSSRPPWSNMPPLSPYYAIPPRPSPFENPRPHYEYLPHEISSRRQKDFWRPSDLLMSGGHLTPMDKALGDEILAALRSTNGGIYYTKSNLFAQVHYVDQYPIYTCALVPNDLVPLDQRKFVTTEVSIGLVRREALDLLGYTYEEMSTGKFAISGDLEQWEVEELVKLSFQALDKSSTKRSKVIIKENGWDEIIRGMNDLPGGYPNTSTVRYFHPVPGPRYPQEPPFREYYSPQLHAEHEKKPDVPDRGDSHQPHQPLVRPRKNSFVRSRGRNNPRTPPNEVKPQEKPQRPASGSVESYEEWAPQAPEVRFTLPRAQLRPSDRHKNEGVQQNAAKPGIPTTSTDSDLRTARLKLDQYKMKQEAAEKAMDIATASDIRYYAIPDLEARIQQLVELQREEQDKNSIPEFERMEAKLETESEGSD